MTGRVPEQATPDGYIGADQIGTAAILTDAQIRKEADRLELIGGDYKPESARYASYELHASDYVERLVFEKDITGYVELPVDAGEILLEPGATLKVYTAETVNLPPNMLALVIALGQLLAAGVAVGSTYVDPGSRGEIYLSMTNLTARTIRIPVGCPIARAMFFVLGSPVQTLHGGPETRRRIRLRVSDESSKVGAASGERVNGSDIEVRLAWHKFAIYVVLGLFVGLAWATAARPLGNDFLNVVVGNSLPKVARLFVPAAILGSFAFVSRDVRATVRQLARAMARRMLNWVIDTPKS